MKVVKVVILAVGIATALAACGGGNKTKSKVAIEEAKVGRDRELFKTAIGDIRDGHEDAGRIELNTIINTYPDSPLVKASKLAMSDSFYLEGGSKNLAQAEAGYREFLQFFPDDPLVDNVMLKMAEIHMRQLMAPDRDPTHAKQAEHQLKELLRLHPDTPMKPEVEGRIREIQEYLAEHEMKVARFYYDLRQAPEATRQRTEEILNKYPNYSKFDEALYYHAKSMADQEDTETASQDLVRIIKEYPHSDYRDKAAVLLKKWNKPVPDPDPAKATDPAGASKAFVPRFFTFVFGPKVNNLSSKGVIIDRTLKTEDIVSRAQELSGVKETPGGPVAPGASTSTNARDNRPRRTTGAGQDVEVKPGSPASQDKSSSKDKKKDSKSDKSPDGSNNN
jgi:outer membrane protein assembly factor BamD